MRYETHDMLIRGRRASKAVPRYRGRPTPLPIVASLFASGLVPYGDHVLDIGCGRNTAAFTLPVVPGMRVGAADPACDTLVREPRWTAIG